MFQHLLGFAGELFPAIRAAGPEISEVKTVTEGVTEVKNITLKW